MRIPNILPMLLLAFTMSVSAQNNCDIYDLTAEVVDCANGEFYAKLNFLHENTSDEGFSVQGNGVTYGPYKYDQLPIAIGPLPADGSTSYGFLVRDLVFQDCAEDVGLGTVDCGVAAPCEIYDLIVDVGDCTSDSTYRIGLDFKVENPTDDHFDLWGNNQFIGYYALSDLPLKIDDFPADGNAGYVRVCINDNPDCCRVKEFDAPDCVQTSVCDITDLTVETGDCMPGGMYKVKLDFEVSGATNDLFEVWAGNGTYLGVFPLGQLPVVLDFPWGGGSVDDLRVCINDNPDCCAEIEFPAPPCFNPCRIEALSVETGDCTSDSTFEIRVKFLPPAASPTDSFSIWAANGDFLGRYAFADMPIQLTDFPWNGGSVDGIRVCVSNNCCRVKEFNVPDCLAPNCGIDDLKVDVGGCITPNKYKLVLDFKLTNPNLAGKFAVWADNGDFLGTYGPDDLPLSLEFPWNGDKVDALKVCLLDDAGNEQCCEIIEFDAPPCVGTSCGIFNLSVETGDCLNDQSYEVWINFQTPSANLSSFGIWTGTGQFLGFYNLNDLPIYIPNFPASGGSTDKIIICFKNACCETKEFNAPDCIGQPCDIVDLSVDTGDCTSDSTYQLTINFQLSNQAPGTNMPFAVYGANGQFIGNFNTADLPITIQDFPWSGNNADAVKICIGNTPNTFCCRVKEFKAPDCLGDPCGIFNLTIETGDCNDDGSYHIWINFQSVSSLGGAFGVWAGNGQFLGVYSVNDLPLHIPNFPGSGNAVDVVEICLITTAGTPPCCRKKEFKAPDCDDPCGLNDLVVETGDCTSDSTYVVWIDFNLNNPSNTTKFAVFANGDLYGEFPLSALPLQITDFPWNGGQHDVIKVCILTPATVLCCETIEFDVPDCLQGGDCEIYDLVVDPGSCTGDSTYSLFLNFQVHNPGQATLYGVWANGQFIGAYSLNDLPLTIQDFPWDGGAVDFVRVCVLDPNDPTLPSDCCAVKEFHVPDCLLHQCEIDDLVVETGDCNADGTYEVWIDFNVGNAPSLSTHFGVWANGNLIGFFPLSQLPLHIPNFPTNGGPNDVVKVCLSNTGSVSCCAIKEFPVPNCNDPCEIFDVEIITGDCHNDGTYTIKVNFEVVNPGNDFFELWAGNGDYLGFFPLSDLPLTIDSFPWDGHNKDVLRICINDNPNCCKEVEFKAPDCVGNGDCEIYDVEVITGDCHNDGTYTIKVNFEVVNPGNDFFELWAGNGDYLGHFPLSDLPLTIEHFPWGGHDVDVLRICINDNPDCCREVEFKAPDCVGPSCEINDLVVETGDCNADGTYHVWVNFNVVSPSASAQFGVWANGTFLGIYPLNDLPLHIENFPTDGGPHDIIKVCLLGGNSPNHPPLCCEIVEFAVPDCVPNIPCQINDLVVETGDCNSDGTYEAWVNFNVSSNTPPGLFYGIWANGEFLGSYPLTDLPFYIENFPTDVGPNDLVEVCLVTPNATQPLCCETIEFPVPDCQGGNCEIWDLQVLTTPCVCGQFFAIVTFEHKNGGSEGFNIVGNGVDYGNFPYSQQQPIILGPLDGDGITPYEFLVYDYLNPDCQDVIDLGKVDCDAPQQQIQLAGQQQQTNAGKLAMSPNPTSNWLNVTAQLNTGTVAGQATVEIRQADGRLVRTVVVPDGSNFQLDVSELQAGLYRLSLQTSVSRLESTFAKQ